MGFHDATIRDICRRAGANVAAVSYHFGDKRGLYKEVLNYADRCAAAMAVRGAAVQPGGGLSAKERLRLFIGAYVAAMLDSGQPSWHGRLIAREMMDPSPVLDAIIDESIRPRSAMLAGIIRELLGDRARAADVVRCKLSVIGQCLIYHSGHHIIQRLDPKYTLTTATMSDLADHITTFSLGAIRQIRTTHKAMVSSKKGARR